jgi:hypothetical protein
MSFIIKYSGNSLSNRLSFIIKSITYEKIENVKPENHEALIADLRDRTGLDINRVQIGRIDFLRDTVKLIIFYYEEDPSNSFNEASTFVSNKNE